MSARLLSLSAIFAGLLLVLTLLGTPAQAERRVALVIGNSNYQTAGKLPNPANDAKAIGDLLKGAGFDIVEVKHDLTNTEFKRVIRTFDTATVGADIVVVYYAGHGIEVEKKNWLVPIDASLRHEADVEDEAVTLDRLTSIAESAKKLGLIILDACRNNPLEKNMERRKGRTRTIASGLAQVEPTGNTLIAFAAKAGSTAEDGAEKHSPYTKALLKYLTEPGLDIQFVLRKVRDEVRERTRSKQDPYFYGTLGGESISLVPAKPALTVVSTANPAVDIIRRDFDFALQVNNRAAWEAFLKQYPTGLHADYAREQLSKLSVPAQPPVTEPDSPISEEQRIFQTLKDKEGPQALEELRKFIKRFPNSPLAIQASRRLETLERARAEREEKVRAEREAEAARKRDEAAAAARKRAEDAARKREEAAEAARKRTEEAAEAARKRDEDAARKREEAAEAARKRAEEAAKKPEQPQDEAVKKPEQPQDEAEIARKRQQEAEAARKRRDAEAARKREAEAARRAAAAEAAAERRKAAETSRRRAAETARRAPPPRREARPAARESARGGGGGGGGGGRGGGGSPAMGVGN